MNVSVWNDQQILVIRFPFQQNSPHSIKAPLLYVFMAQNREALDYRKIVKTVLSRLKNETAVEEIVTDFKRAVRRTFTDLMPDVKLL